MEDHPAFRLMAAFWDSAAGDGSETRLSREMLNCMPSESRAISLAQSIVKLQQIKQSKFYGFLGIGSKAVYTSGLKFVEDIKGNKPPVYDTTKNSPFMTSVMEACAYWCTCPPQGAAGANAEAPAPGKPAAQQLLQTVRDKHAGKTNQGGRSGQEEARRVWFSPHFRGAGGAREDVRLGRRGGFGGPCGQVGKSLKGKGEGKVKDRARGCIEDVGVRAPF